MKSKRIMYIESKPDGICGPGRIGAVNFSKTGRTLYYHGRKFQSLKGNGFKTNYIDIETGEEVWISGCKKDGSDSLYSTIIEIDDDVMEDYWTIIRELPELKTTKKFKCRGKYTK